MPPAADKQSATAANDAAATKRMKKREIDRRCQREARQRTKSRIAYLEGLVEELRRKDTSGQVASLMQQVSDVRKERDMFARTLRGIEDSIRSHRSLLEGVHPKQESNSPPTVEQNDSSDDSPESPPPVNGTAGGGAQRFSVSTAEVPGSLAAISAPTTAYSACTHRRASTLAGPNGCECHIPLQPDELPSRNGPDLENDRSGWRFAQSILDSRPVLSSKLLRWEDAHSDDIPVRAVTEGWPAVVARLGGNLPPLWRKLRRIDEVIFANCDKVERLAILRVMHLLLRNHADPASQKATVPSWYLARPSQNMAHSYAVDFFTWPGIRERFVFSQHKYCSNLFWHLHNAHMKIVWQYDFRDCYTVNRQTGTYKISQAFEERISDINAWTMGSAFFQRWPELHGDIPTYESIASPMNVIAPPPLLVDFAAQGPSSSSRQIETEPAAENGPTSPQTVRTIDSPTEVALAERRGSAESMFENTSNFPPMGTLYDPMDEDAHGETDFFFTGPDESLMHMLPTSLSKPWEPCPPDPLPENEWIWLTSTYQGSLAEPA